MTEVAIYSNGTYHMFFFEGNTLKEVHLACTEAWSRVINTTYLPGFLHPMVSLFNDLRVCVPLNPEELEEVSRKGGRLYLFADDLYLIKVSPIEDLEKGFINLFYDL